MLVLALGNPILCDDGVAFHVLEAMRPRLEESDDLVLEEAATGGIDLLTFFAGFDRVLVIDAVKTREQPVGTVRRYAIEDFNESLHADSPHSTNFATAVEFGRRFHPEEMPEDVAVLGIEVDVIDCFTEELTEPVAACVPRAVEASLEVLREWGVGPAADAD